MPATTCAEFKALAEEAVKQNWRVANALNKVLYEIFADLEQRKTQTCQAGGEHEDAECCQTISEFLLAYYDRALARWTAVKDAILAMNNMVFVVDCGQVCWQGNALEAWLQMDIVRDKLTTFDAEVKFWREFQFEMRLKLCGTAIDPLPAPTPIPPSP